MGKSVVLYVDIVSPFAYIAYWLTRNSPAFKSLQIEYVPILLGGIMQQTGNTPPINIKNKDKWISSEMRRWATSLKVPMLNGMPQPFPQPTTNAQRALCYIQTQMPAESLVAAIDALYEAFWVHGKTINKPEVLQEALGTKFSPKEVEQILEGVKSDEAKKTLRGNSDRAYKDGCFGLPWFVATNENGKTEGFWGVDHIGQLLEFLGVEIPAGETRYRAML